MEFYTRGPLKTPLPDRIMRRLGGTASIPLLEPYLDTVLSGGAPPLERMLCLYEITLLMASLAFVVISITGA